MSSSSRIEVDGTFQLSSFNDPREALPTTGSGQSSNRQTVMQAMKARGKGSMHVQVKVAGANVFNQVVQLSTASDSSLLIVVLENDGGQQYENDLPYSITGKPGTGIVPVDSTYCLVILPEGSKVSSIECSVDGKIDSCDMNSHSLITNSFTMGSSDYHRWALTGISPAAPFYFPNGASFSDALSNVLNIHPMESVTTTAQGRGHLGTVLVA